MTTTQHLGIAHMEASTWKRKARPARARRQVSKRIWWAVGSRIAVGTLALLVLGGMAQFGTHEPGRSHDPRGAGFKWSAIEPETGRQVPRSEWIAKALENS